MNLKTVDIEDQRWVKPLLQKSQYQSIECNFVTMYMWWDGYGIMYGEYEGMFVARYIEGDHAIYMYPAGDVNLEKWFAACCEDAEKLGKKVAVNGFGEEQEKALKEILGDKIAIVYNEDFHEYVYTQEKLATLSGKKLHSKRNHISYFERTYNWNFEPLSDDNVEDCIVMNNQWCVLHHGEDTESLRIENCAIERTLRNYKELGVFGGVLKIDGEVVAFSFGSPCNDDTVDVHVEKAFSDFRGAYPMINREFARMCEGYKYLNREEDMGEEGLRKAKHSYQPVYLLEKFVGEVTL